MAQASKTRIAAYIKTVEQKNKLSCLLGIM